MSRRGTTAQMRRIVQAMDTAHVDCRDLTHAWEPYTAAKEGGGYKRIVRCPRCGTRRIDLLTRAGGVRRRRYVYPENYLVKGIGQLTGDTKNMMRLEGLKRLMNMNGTGEQDT